MEEGRDRAEPSFFARLRHELRLMRYDIPSRRTHVVRIRICDPFLYSWVAYSWPAKYTLRGRRDRSGVVRDRNLCLVDRNNSIKVRPRERREGISACIFQVIHGRAEKKGKSWSLILGCLSPPLSVSHSNGSKLRVINPPLPASTIGWLMMVGSSPSFLRGRKKQKKKVRRRRSYGSLPRTKSEGARKNGRKKSSSFS